MRLRKFHHCERGTSTLELTLLMPLIVFVMLFLIGMGYALITKQHAVVAARFAVTYHRFEGRAPSAQDVSKAASNSEDRWKLSGRTTNTGGDAYRGIGSGVAGVVSSVFSTFLGSAGQNGRISYVAATTPTRGLLPRLYTIGDATSQYQVEAGTWTCDKGNGYLSLMLSKVPLPGLSQFFGGSCCKTYQAR